MKPNMARESLGKVARKRCVARCHEDLDITLPEHHAPVTGAGRDGFTLLKVGLDGKWGQAKAAALECVRRRIHCGDEMGDMVEENLPPSR